MEITAALALAALVLYVPANLYPILKMNTSSRPSSSSRASSSRCSSCSGSAFWDVSGVNVKGGIFKGLELQLDSLRSEPKPEWLAWAPKIPIPPEK